MIFESQKPVTLARLRRAELEAAAPNRPDGYLDDFLSRAVRSDAENIWVPADDYRMLAGKYSAPAAQGGPGTELKKILRLFGITASPTCSCNSRARQMDQWGADECERRIDEIVGWLREQAQARKLPFVAFAAKKLVQAAIARTRKRAAKGALGRHKSK